MHSSLKRSIMALIAVGGLGLGATACGDDNSDVDLNPGSGSGVDLNPGSGSGVDLNPGSGSGVDLDPGAGSGLPG
jgi:hypothetical protein